MSKKTLPLGHGALLELAMELPTPFYLYDEEAIIENYRAFKEHFAWAPNFKNYFAVKACPNPTIIRALAKEGSGVDCSSLPELLISEAVGLAGDDIVFTSNDTPANEFKMAYELGAIINLDDITHIQFLEDILGLFPETICFGTTPAPSAPEMRSSATPSKRSTELPRARSSTATRSPKRRGEALRTPYDGGFK